MKLKVALLLLAGMFIFGCATNPCAPLLKHEPVLKNQTIQMGLFEVHAYDVDGDGTPDRMSVYVPWSGDDAEREGELVEIYSKELTEEEAQEVLNLIGQQK